MRRSFSSIANSSKRSFGFGRLWRSLQACSHLRQPTHSVVSTRQPKLSVVLADGWGAFADAALGAAIAAVAVPAHFKKKRLLTSIAHPLQIGLKITDGVVAPIRLSLTLL